jgi:hypothetical protein
MPVILSREDGEGPVSMQPVLVAYGSFGVYAPQDDSDSSNDIEDVIALAEACEERNPQRRLGRLTQPAGPA